MAITYKGAGTSDNGSTTLEPTYPATVDAGDLALLTVVTGGSTDPTPSTPAGFTLGATFLAGEGSWGVNTGSRRVTVFYRVCDGTEDGTTLTVSVTGGNTGGAFIETFSKTLTSWVLEFFTGSKDDALAGGWTVAFTGVALAAGDIVHVASAPNNRSAGFTDHALATAEATFVDSFLAESLDFGIATGNDSKLVCAWDDVATATGSPGTATYTASTSQTATGPAILTRISEEDPGGGAIELAATLSAALTATAEADRVAALAVDLQGALTATAEADRIAALTAALSAPLTATASPERIAALLAALQANLAATAAPDRVAALQAALAAALAATAEAEITGANMSANLVANLAATAEADRVAGLAADLVVALDATADAYTVAELAANLQAALAATASPSSAINLAATLVANLTATAEADRVAALAANLQGALTATAEPARTAALGATLQAGLAATARAVPAAVQLAAALAAALTATARAAFTNRAAPVVSRIIRGLRTVSRVVEWIGRTGAMRIEAETDEEMTVTIEARLDPTGVPPEWAATPATDPMVAPASGWVAGSWDPLLPWSTRTGRARPLSPAVGAGQDLDVAAGEWDLWVAWTEVDRRPVKWAGRITVR